MTTRNQKRNQSAKSKPPSSNTNAVDFPKQPIVALPAMNSSSSLADSAREPAVQPNPCGYQLQSPSNLRNSSSSPAVHTATQAPADAVSPLNRISSNPVVRDIDALKSGELKVVSPAVSKFFGFPAGPVEKLNFSDPKVAEFFNVPLPLSGNHVLDTVPVAGVSVQPTMTETAAPVPVSGSVPVQNPTSTVSSTTAAPLLSGNAIAQASPAAVGGLNVGVGSTARPPPMAADKPPTTQTTPPVSSWAGLFKKNRVLNDDTKMNPNFVGVSSEDVVLNDDDLEDEDEEKRSLIGFFNGKFPGINAIQRIVDDWSRKCSFHLHNSGWLVFTFEEEEDCEIVLKEGPYYAFNKPLVLKKMPEFFDFSDEAYSTAPVWIQLPNLPLRAWKKSALEKICSFLGTPLHIDLVTKEKTQKSFARCLVEVDVSKDLPNIVTCVLPRGKILRQHVLYEETPTFCSNCKKLGHDTEDCYSKNNGVPSLYVTKSKQERVKKNGKVSGKAGVARGAAKHGQGSGALAFPAPAPQAATTAAPLGNVAAGNMGGATVTRQQVGAPSVPMNNNNKANDLNKKNGSATDVSANVPGLVSTNPFGPLANDVVSGLNDAEASTSKDINNKKKNNGRKK